jgi:MraZ protein
VFTGEYRHSVDEKGRMAVPARFRVQLAGGAYVSRWIDGCLAIFPREDWDVLAAKVAGLPYESADGSPGDWMRISGPSVRGRKPRTSLIPPTFRALSLEMS